MGVYTRSGDAARHLDRARPAESERLVRGPIAIAWSPEDTVACGEVDGVTCFMSGYLYEAADLARDWGGRDERPTSSLARIVASATALLDLRGRFAALGRAPSVRSARLRPARDGAALLLARAGPARVRERAEGPSRCSPATPGPDPLAFTSWLGGGLCPADRTLYDGVSRLRPGRLIDLGPAACEPRRYWRPRYQGTMSGTRDELAEGLRAEIERSVGRRLSPRLSGVVLSGGLDSSIVTAVASRQREPGTQLRTYSAVFPGRPFDEGWKVRAPHRGPGDRAGGLRGRAPGRAVALRSSTSSGGACR